jgi:ubiquinone/menaquinone biosynthesis C-methylase UbiE
VNTAEEWNRIYSGSDDEGGEDAWLERWRHVLEASQGSRVLDLGCGAGHDTAFLVQLGLPVVAADFSEEALKITRRRAPAAKTENLNLTRTLPFPDAAFGVIVASLSLHYFPWHQTTRILRDIRRCLGPDGHLLARFNSTQDPHYSAAEKQTIEKNFYLVAGMPKRLFDSRDIATLFAKGWKLLAADERITRRYGDEKLAWEVAAKKSIADKRARRSRSVLTSRRRRRATRRVRRVRSGGA